MIQNQFISYLLESKDSSIIKLNNLTSDYFSQYKNEFNFILNHLDRYNVIPDLATFLNVFPDFKDVHIKVQEPDSYLIEELFKDYQNRKIANTFNKIADLLYKGDTERATALFKQEAEELHTGVALKCVDILRDTSRYDAYVDRTENFNKYFISTGFKELDAVIGGWNREDELAVITAKTNQGKSWIMLKCAAAAAEQGLTVGIYSGEMTENKVGYRLDTILGHISNGGMVHGNSIIKNEYKHFIEQLPTKYTGSIKVLTPSMIDGSAGVNALRMFIEKENLDILFVDQHSLLEDDRGAKDPVEKASNISKDLKNLQVLIRKPIIAVAQQKRGGNSGDEDIMDPEQIAQAYRINQDATTTIGISRDKKDNSVMTLHIIKSRDSQVGIKLKYIVDLNRGLWEYVQPEDGEDNIEMVNLHPTDNPETTEEKVF